MVVAVMTVAVATSKAFRIMGRDEGCMTTHGVT